jgi:hypothetical protein
MDKLIELFEKSLAEYQASIGKKDNLIGSGEIIIAEFKKQRDQIVTLGQLLSDFYAQARLDGTRVQNLTVSEVFNLQEFRRDN